MTRRKFHVAFIALVLASAVTPMSAQETKDGPASDKAQKTYKEAFHCLNEGQKGWALENFKKADKQDGGHCLACQKQIIKFGCEVGDWKAAELAAEEMVAEAKLEKDTALAHYQFAEVLLAEGRQKHKDEILDRAHDEAAKALAAYPSFPAALLLDGIALANLGRDEAAKARFEQYLKMKPGDDPERQRVLRYVDRPELARARMAPPFAVTTADGKRISMDDLRGKVVLLDFWATWCGPCRAQHPLYEETKTRFKDNPDVMFLSIDTDDNHALVKPFVESQKWTQKIYFDDGLQYLLQVSNIPTTVIFGKKGEVLDRMIGYLPDRFVDMLTERINDALGKPATLTPTQATSPPAPAQSTNPPAPAHAISQ